MEITTRLNPAQIENLSFEEAYERLNDTAGKLERGNLSLEDSLTLYEEGVLLSQHCEELLNRAELRVTQINPSAPAEDEIEDEDEQYEDDLDGDDGQLTLAEIDF